MRIKKEHRAMPRKKDYLTVNDFCIQVTLTEGKKISVSNAQVKEIFKIIRKKIMAITEKPAYNESIQELVSLLDIKLSCPGCKSRLPVIDLYEIVKCVKLT
jgi:hypothetical protein